MLRHRVYPFSPPNADVVHILANRHQLLYISCTSPLVLITAVWILHTPLITHSSLIFFLNNPCTTWIHMDGKNLAEIGRTLDLGLDFVMHYNITPTPLSF